MANQRFRSSVTWSGEGVRSVARMKNKEVIIDEPAMMGGTDQGATPVEYLLAALGGCINVCMVSFAPMHGVELRDVRTTIDGLLDPDGFTGKNPNVRNGFSEISYSIEVDSPSPVEAVRELIQHAEHACPVKDTLKGVSLKLNKLEIKEAAAAVAE